MGTVQNNPSAEQPEDGRVTQAREKLAGFRAALDDQTTPYDAATWAGWLSFATEILLDYIDGSERRVVTAESIAELIGQSIDRAVAGNSERLDRIEEATARADRQLGRLVGLLTQAVAAEVDRTKEARRTE
jgi:hypothetical protein